MANRAVVVDLLVRTGQFTTGMKRASADMASETTNMQTKTRALQGQIGLLGVAMTAMAAVAVVKWAQFDQAMARVEATGGEAAKQIELLNAAAKSDEVIELGYSATEASNAIYELVKAGVQAEDIIGGGMAGAMSLAAAETMDAAESAAIMASALTQFNLTGKDSAHVADLIVAAAGKAQGSAHDLGFALKQSGLVANQFGLSIEETTGTLALFASAGLIGSDAGTSLRTMLLHLAGPSTKAAKLMDEIGLEIYGANGQMVDMETLANNLQSSMGKLTEKQRNQALATIFGADATRAASLLYREGGDAVVEWMEKVDDAGYATEVARKRMDNLAGDVKKMSATWERSMIEMGESADGPLRKLVQGITQVIDWFGNLDPIIQGVLMALVGGGGLFILAVLGIAQVVSALSTLRAGLISTGVVSEATAGKMSRGFGKVAKAAGILAAAYAAVVAVAQALEDRSDPRSANEWAKTLLDTADAAGFASTEIKGIVSDSYDLETAWARMKAPGALDSFDDWSGDFLHMNSSLDLVTAEFENMGQALATLYASDPALAAEKFQLILDATGASTEDLLKAMPAYKDALDGTDVEQGLVAESADELRAKAQELGIAFDGTAESAAAVTAAEVEAEKAHQKYIESIVESFTSFLGLGDVYQSVIDKQKEWAESTAEETETSKDSWEDFYDGQTVSADQYIKELEKQVKAQEEWADNLLSLTSRVKDGMPSYLQVAAQEMITELRNLGPEGAAQIALLESMSDAELQKVVELYARQGAATGAGWADEVEAAEDPEVDIDTAPADTKLEALQEDLDDMAGQHVVIPFQADIHGALSEIDRLQRAIDASAGQHVVIPFGDVPGRRATGGPIIGPGTGTSDSIPALLSNGEHVLTADDVQKAGGQTGVYRMRSAIQSGMLRFATGGAVGGKSLDYWQDAMLNKGEILDLQIRIRDLKKDLAATGKDRLRGLDREKALYELSTAQRELKDGLYANKLNKSKSIAKRIAEQEAKEEAAEKEKERKANLAEQKSDYTTDINRGNFKGDLTGGMSGVYSTIDQLRKDVLPDLVGSQKTALADALAAAERNAKNLYTELDAVDETLKSATEQAEELQSVSDAVQSGLAGGFRLSDVAGAAQVGAVNPFTGVMTGGGGGSSGQGMLRAAQEYSGKVKIFAGKLKQLADRGFAGVILQEIAAMGVDAGIPAADALLTLDPSDTSAMNKAYEDINAFAGQAGQAVTEGFYEGGLAAADGLVAGLEARRGAIQQAIMDMAMDMQDALKVALGIASPSRKFRAMMKFVGDGVVLGLDDQSGAVADASARMFAGVTVPGYSVSYGAGGSASGGGDITASLSDAQVERLAVAFETGNVRNINAATAQQNQKVVATYGVRGR